MALNVHSPFGPVFANELDDPLILLLGPGPLNQLGVHHLLPPVLALHIRPVGKVRGDEVPALPVDLHQALQLLVLQKAFVVEVEAEHLDFCDLTTMLVCQADLQ